MQVKQIKVLMICMSCAIMSFLLVDYMMLRNSFHVANNEVVVLISSIVVFMSKKDKSKFKFDLFSVLLIAIVISTFMRGDNNYFLLNICSVLALTVFYNLSRDEYEYAVYGIFIGIFPELVSWIIRRLFSNILYLGNRGPLCFTVVGFMLMSVLIKDKRFLAFFVVVFNSLVCFLGSSRTSLICNFGCIVLMLLYVWRGKLSKKKILNIIALSIIALFVIFMVQDKVISLVTNKFGSAASGLIFSGREVMWKYVLNDDIRIWGYPDGFLLKQFNLANIHNSYLQAYVMFGVAVGIIYLTWCIKTLVKSIRSYRVSSYAPLCIALLSITVVSLLESTFIMDPGYPLLGICVVLLSGQINKLNESE